MLWRKWGGGPVPRFSVNPLRMHRFPSGCANRRWTLPTVTQTRSLCFDVIWEGARLPGWRSAFFPGHPSKRSSRGAEEQRELLSEVSPAHRQRVSPHRYSCSLQARK